MDLNLLEKGPNFNQNLDRADTPDKHINQEKSSTPQTNMPKKETFGIMTYNPLI